MEEKYAPKRAAEEALPDEEIAAADAAVMKGIKKKKKKKLKTDDALPAAQEEPAPVVPEGFELDSATGFYHNSETGQYYEAKSQIYCCYNNGEWFYYDTATQEYKPWVLPGENKDSEPTPESEAAVDLTAEDPVVAPAPTTEVQASATPPQPEDADDSAQDPDPTQLAEQNDDGFTFVAFGE
eukprot:TRINITY_DN4415_c0_g1_i2.p1 TRINITY_DN4415_c0_g1~~TRINITY_DN4415_c0_g1_i2.p1  ORF type:complete len:182 (+),score=48.77 TRINITY_DN4415_c0_g1_i2:537-1082(+)